MDHEVSDDWHSVFCLEFTDIRMSDIALFLSEWYEEGDMAEWSGAMIGILKDGRYVAASGWCDSTGWG